MAGRLIGLGLPIVRVGRVVTELAELVIGGHRLAVEQVEHVEPDRSVEPIERQACDRADVELIEPVALERGTARDELAVTIIAVAVIAVCIGIDLGRHGADRSEEHPSELQSLMTISYAVICL